MLTLYFDGLAGVSGDMILGAMVDLGLDLEQLKCELGGLKIGGYSISARRVARSSIAATKVDVTLTEAIQPERDLEHIRELIADSSLSESVKSRSVAVFERIAEAEGRVHGCSAAEVHFHEVGAVDAIVDIVGAMIGVEMLGPAAFFAGPLRVGSGQVNVAHGALPVPAPGTAELLRGAPVYGGEIPGEFVTPTGAAIVTSLCRFGPLPRMTIQSIGYGAGSKDPRGLPNVLRLILGETDAIFGEERGPLEPESIVVIETNIDDMNPQAFGFVMKKAFEMGALDVFMTPVQMKKGRPGVLLTVLCVPELAGIVSDMLLSETTTLGVRCYAAARRTLDRTMEIVVISYGSIRIKVARRNGRIIHFQPEFEDCVAAAGQYDVPLMEVQAAASAAFRARVNASLKEEGRIPGESL
jgi:uncharacterized protein (TIGR00299 family) protein